MMRKELLVAALGVSLFILWAPSPAHADKETSVQLYKAGKRKYELGDYKKAITLFQQAYEEHPAPAYLFNVALAHVKLENCSDALTYFKRYIEEKPDATNRAEVEAQIAEIEASCVVAAPAPEPEPEPVPEPEPKEPDPVPVNTETKGTSGNGETGIVKTGPTLPRRKLFAAGAEAGLAFYNIGDVIVPVTPSLRLQGALPLEYFGIAFEPYGAIELQTMAYEHSDGDSTVMFTTLMVGASATYPVMPKIAVGGDIGFGILHFAGLEMGNPFIAAGAAQAESINTIGLRLGGQAEYDVGGGLSAAFSPAFVIASGDDSLRDEISSISRFELMLGVRYRL